MDFETTDGKFRREMLRRELEHYGVMNESLDRIFEMVPQIKEAIRRRNAAVGNKPGKEDGVVSAGSRLRVIVGRKEK